MMRNFLPCLCLASAAMLAINTPRALAATQPNATTSYEQRLADCLNSTKHRPFNDQPCLDVLSSPQAEAQPREDSALPGNPGIQSTPTSPGVVLARAHAALAAGYAASGKLVEADQHLRDAEALAANDWHTRANIGVVHLYNNRFVEAQQAFSDAMVANPDFPPHLLLNRSLAWRGLGRFVESARDVDEYEYLSASGAQSPGQQGDCATAVAGCTPARDVGPHPDRSGFRNPG